MDEKYSHEESLKELSRLTSKDHVFITGRGNISIKLSFKLARHLGFSKILVQDQGGWLTYGQFARKEKLSLIELKTDYGVLDPVLLDDFSDCVLVVNSMPGYLALQDMAAVAKKCVERGIFLINDASGSIGTKEAFFGDVVLGSFGFDKPVNLGAGGFVAVNTKDYAVYLSSFCSLPVLDYEKLQACLRGLDSRLQNLRECRAKVMEVLADNGLSDGIIHKNSLGLNLAVRYFDESERERLINICEKENIEFTLCPRKIRVLEKAVCFEIKRKQF